MEANRNTHIEVNRPRDSAFKGYCKSVRSKLLTKFFGTEVGIIVLNPGSGNNEVIIKTLEE